MKRRILVFVIMAVMACAAQTAFAQTGGTGTGKMTPAQKLDHLVTGGSEVQPHIVNPEDIPETAKPPVLPGDEAVKPTTETVKPTDATKPEPAGAVPETGKTLTSHTELTPVPEETPASAEGITPVTQDSASKPETVPADGGAKNVLPDDVPPQEKLPPPVMGGDEKPVDETAAKPADPPPAASLSPVTALTGIPTAETPAPAASAEKIAMEKMVYYAQLQMTNPRATVQYLINRAAELDYKRAALTLDLSRQPEMTEDEKEKLAFKMYNILIRLDGFVSQGIPEELDGDVYYIYTDEQQYRAIVLRKTKGIWKFAPESVLEIPQFYAKIENKPPVGLRLMPLLKHLPDGVYARFAGLMYLDWIVLGVFFLLGLVVCRITPAVTSYVILMPMRNMRKDEELIKLTKAAIRPLAYLAMLYIWYSGVQYVQIPPLMLKIAGWVIHPMGILLMMLSVLRVTDIFGLWLRNYMQKTQNKIGNALADLMANALKVLFVCTGVIAVAQVYGFSAIGILSGMGIGGIAVALAAQNTVANFFGSLMILMDRPFTIGDYIISDKIEGVVESIGLRSTRIRTFYNSLIVIPNGILAAATIDNMERRYYRRYRATLTLRYGTPVRVLEEFCKRVTDAILLYPDSKKVGVQVYVTELGDWSINVLLNCHFAASTAVEENEAKQRLNFDILRLAEELGVVFASTGDREVTAVQTPPLPPQADVDA